MASLWSPSQSEEVHEEEEEDYDPSAEQEDAATSDRSDQIVVAAPTHRPAAPSATAMAPHTRGKRPRVNQEATAGRRRRARTNEASDGAEASQPPPPPPPPGPKVTAASKLRSKAWKDFTLIEQPDPDE